jgi:hypothetical protein
MAGLELTRAGISRAEIGLRRGELPLVLDAQKRVPPFARTAQQSGSSKDTTAAVAGTI